MYENRPFIIMMVVSVLMGFSNQLHNYAAQFTNIAMYVALKLCSYIRMYIIMLMSIYMHRFRLF